MRSLERALWIGLLLLGMVVAGPSRAGAAPITFTASSGDLAASAVFDISGTNLLVTLTNTSPFDVLVPTDVLTAVFFDITDDPALTSVSATLASGSTVWFGSNGGGNVGGEWAYAHGLSGAPNGATQGISSTGLGLFGGPTFPGADLQRPLAVDGLQYGITSAGDDPTTGNTAVTGTYALIHNSVVFVLGGLPGGFSLDDISNVTFQYGTSPSEVPEPSTVALLGLGLLMVAGRTARKRIR